MITATPNGYDAATYGESFADVYDAWYGDVSDVDAVVAGVLRLAAGGRVLELGVGTGRLALPIAAAGLRIVGVDASPAMLAALAAKLGADRITSVLADMADLPDLGEPFTLAFAAFNTFFNLATDADQASCMRSVRRQLTADGYLVIEGFVPPADGLADGGVSVRDVNPDGAVITVSKHDPDRQEIRGQHIEMHTEGNRLRPWLLHYQTPDQLDAAAAAAGFVLCDRWADWDGAAFDSSSANHVSVYRRP